MNALGDGGFVTTNNKNLYDKIKVYRNHGMVGRDKVEFAGVNSRLDSLHAEILSFRLNKLKSVISKRSRNINLYKKYLSTNKVKIIDNDKKNINAHVMFITLCQNRDKLQKYLKNLISNH